ncbi:hypothetical protein MMC14_001792 [Varicellaria rhodocarpa]|nr:hypothetical protein [Varicellaria rhodocarpa]
MAAPTPAQIQYMEAHISDDRRPGLIASVVIPLSIASIAVVLRFIARRRVRAPLLADDWLILASLVCYPPTTASRVVLDILSADPFSGKQIITSCYDISAIFTIHNGVGRHIILVTNAKALIQAVITSEILYCISLAPIKISILLLYHRIFPSKRVYVASIIIGVIVICYSIAQAISLGLQCEPGRCFSTNPLFKVTAILNIITDTAILSLPIPSLWRLQVSRTSKIQLFGIFALGGLYALPLPTHESLNTSISQSHTNPRKPSYSNIVFAIIRATVTADKVSWDPSWGNVNGAIWSCVEIPTGIVSACLPTLRPLLPKWAQNNTSRKFSYPPNKGSWKIKVKIPTAKSVVVDSKGHGFGDGDEVDGLTALRKPEPSRRMDRFERMREVDDYDRGRGREGEWV